MNAVQKTSDSCCGFNKARWLCIAVYLMLTVISGYIYYGVMKDLIPILLVLSLFAAVFLHGLVRYGLKNLLVFFIITWVISSFFEALSIQTGFPFGHYFYDQLAGPRIFQVPMIIMLAYFSMGYTSWMLANVLLGQYGRRISGNGLLFIPLIAAFIMVMWDVCMDPIASTIGSLWKWQDGGRYFGVPLQNYFGWFFVVYLIFQVFAFYISKFDRVDGVNKGLYLGKFFWFESVAVYAIQALTQLLDPLIQTQHLDIYGPMAMITIFTMVFVALLAGIKIYNDETGLL